jgi:hypothetical protein
MCFLTKSWNSNAESRNSQRNQENSEIPWTQFFFFEIVFIYLYSLRNANLKRKPAHRVQPRYISSKKNTVSDPLPKNILIPALFSDARGLPKKKSGHEGFLKEAVVEVIARPVWSLAKRG